MGAVPVKQKTTSTAVKSTTWWVLLVATITPVVFGIAMFLNSASLAREALTAELESKGKAIVKTLSMQTQQALLRNDSTTVQGLLDEIDRVEDVQYVFVVDDKGETVAHTFVPIFPAEIRTSNVVPNGSAHIQAKRLNYRNSGILDLAAPLMLGVMGEAHVGMNITEGLTPLMERLQRRTAIATIIAILIEAGFLYFTIRHFVNALNHNNVRLRGTIAELETTRSSLIQSSKMSALGEMAGGIAHEINNPLAIIDGTAGILRQVIDNPSIDKAQIKRMATTITDTCQRIGKIVRGLRTFSRESSKDPFEEVAARTIVDDALALCGERLRQRGVTLRTAGILADLTLHCRPSEICQVLLNLLNNAHDAVETQPDRWIGLHATGDSNGVTFSVTDSGSGIVAEIRDKILEPFFTTKAVGKGTGLGLSVTKGIIDSHGGKLWLDIESPNTRFCVWLPRSTTRPTETPTDARTT